MQNIGDRLTEARKRLGLDLRQASEATKIRTDYLTAMENGAFDFSLPEVYKKGFLKIYARYLKLDADKISADFVAQFSTSGSPARREGQENLGRVDAPGGFGPGAVSSFENLAADQAASAQKQAAMIRLATFVAIAFVFIVLLVMVLQHMLQGNPLATDAKTADATTPAATAKAPAPPPATPAAPAVPAVIKLVFIASSDINLQVWQEPELTKLYSGVLKKGQPLAFTAKAPVRVSASQTQFLTIQVNGEQARPVLNGDTGKLVTGPATFLWPPN